MDNLLTITTILLIVYMFYPKVMMKFNKNSGKPILVHCSSGGRSPKAVTILLKNNFGPIYPMKPGLAGFNGTLKSD